MVDEQMGAIGECSEVDLLVQKIEPNESVVSADLHDEAILLNVETGIYFGLDPVGTQIWRWLAEGKTLGEIFDLLLAEYDVEPSQLRAELTSFVDLLTTKDLIRVLT
jgi:hypothetical protein